MPANRLLSSPAATQILSHGPTPSTAFTANPVAPGGYVLSRLDAAPLTTAEIRAQERSYALSRALKDPTATLTYHAGAYLNAVQTRSATPHSLVHFIRTTRQVLTPGPRGGKGRWTTEEVWSASTLTVTTTPFSYRTPVTTAQHYQPCPAPSTTDPRHPDVIRAAAQRARQEAARHRASLTEARRAARRSRRRYAEVPGSQQ